MVFSPVISGDQNRWGAYANSLQRLQPQQQDQTQGRGVGREARDPNGREAADAFTRNDPQSSARIAEMMRGMGCACPSQNGNLWSGVPNQIGRNLGALNGPGDPNAAPNAAAPDQQPQAPAGNTRSRRTQRSRRSRRSQQQQRSQRSRRSQQGAPQQRARRTAANRTRQADQTPAAGPVSQNEQGIPNGLRPNTAAGARTVRAMGFRGTIGGIGHRSGPSDHPSGNAIDVMTHRDVATGNRIAEEFRRNHAQHKVKYVIWQQQIASAATGWQWRPMADRGNPTANHRDHVHISFQR